MKKLTKKLGMSTLALASVFALGFSAVNTVASNNVSTQASASTMAYEGDIDSVEGVTLVDNVTLDSFELGTSTTATTGAKLTVTVDAAGAAANSSTTNFLTYNFVITMPATYVYSADHGSAFSLQANSAGYTTDVAQDNYFGDTPVWNGTDKTWSMTITLPRVVNTWEFTLYANDTMNNNYDDTSVTDGHTMEVIYSFEVNSWEYDSKMIVSPEFLPYYDNATLDWRFTPESYDGYIEYSFDLHVNGFDYLQNSTGVNSDELHFSGMIYVPYLQTTATSDDNYKGFLIDVNTSDLADDNTANNSNEDLLAVNKIEGSDTISTADDVYDVTIRANVGGAEMQSKGGSNTLFMLIDNTYNVGRFNGAMSQGKDTSGKVDDPGTVAVENSTTGVQDEAAGFVTGSVLFSDTWTNDTTADAQWADDPGTSGVNEANYARYSTLDMENTVFSVSMKYNAVTTSNVDGSSTGAFTEALLVPSKAQFDNSQSAYKAYINGNPWGLTGTNTAITAIVLASIFGVTTIGLGAYIVVNNNKAKKAKTHTSTTHSHDKK